jgi:hypothetical protein
VRVVFAQRRVRLADGGGVETFRSLPFGHPLLEVLLLVISTVIDGELDSVLQCSAVQCGV